MDAFSITADEIAERYGLALRGDGGLRIRGVGTLSSAGEGQLTFLANPRYRNQLSASNASVVVLREEDAAMAPGTVLIARDPYTTFAKIAALFDRQPVRDAGVHPS